MSKHLIPLREHIDQQFLGRDALLESKIETLLVRFDSMDKATIIANTALDQRLANMNAWREQMRDQQVNFPTREEVQSYLAEIKTRLELEETAREKALESNLKRITALETNLSNLQGRTWAIGAFIAGFSVVFSIVVQVLHLVP